MTYFNLFHDVFLFLWDNLLHNSNLQIILTSFPLLLAIKFYLSLIVFKGMGGIK